MKWMVIKGVRYPSSVISAFAAYNMDNPFLKVRIRNKYHIVPFDDVNKMASQMVYLMNNYPDFVQIGRWWISKKAVMSWVPKGQAAEELVSSCGLTEDECRELQEESGSFNDEMLDFINSVFGHEDMINNSITLENIGYHKIGSIFKYNIGSKEVELEVVESSDASCEGCVFNNSKNYYCKDTHCIDVDRKDDIDVIYKEVKRS